MPTSGQAAFFRQNINSYIALAFVGSFALLVGLVIVHAAFGYNPLAELIAHQAAAAQVAL